MAVHREPLPSAALKTLAVAAALAFIGSPNVAHAHPFGRPYNLPVPFWLYAYATVAALVISFLLVALFLSVPAQKSRIGLRVAFTGRHPRLIAFLRGASVATLFLCLATGFFGSPDPYRNFNMTFFWIVFALGFLYLAALVGDFYAVINPWRVIADAIGRVSRGFQRGRVRYPRALGHWPALVLYMAFIWIELFARTGPFSLAAILLAYTALSSFGVWLIGVAWFRYCDVFSVLFRLVAKMAPVEVRDGRLHLRPPFAGLIGDRAESMGLVVFVLFMLSSTAFDGLRATALWVRFIWSDPLQIVRPGGMANPTESYAVLRAIYLAFESSFLFLSPFVYLAVYVAFLWLTKLATGSRLSLRELALRFAYSLLPIGLVYNVTHYYTLLLVQGGQILSLASDPFGWGWNLFGTAGWFAKPILPSVGLVWHSQVALILFGHVIAVVLAHREALDAFPTRRSALVSQLPMLGLMVLFTVAGLWILAQPLSGGY